LAALVVLLVLCGSGTFVEVASAATAKKASKTTSTRGKKTVKVRSYKKKDGTTVQSHSCRTPTKSRTTKKLRTTKPQS